MMPEIGIRRKSTLMSYVMRVQRHHEFVNSHVQERHGENHPDIFGVPHADNSSRLDRLLRPVKNKHINVVEVATGSKFTTPYTLYQNGYDFSYISFDVYPKLQSLNIKGIRDFGISGSIFHVLASATQLQLPNNFADVCIYLHAINDIWYTEGMCGIRDSLSESLRVLKPDGCIISADAYMDVDPTTTFVSHVDVKECLDRLCKYSFEEYDNDVPGRGWLKVYDIVFL